MPDPVAGPLLVFDTSAAHCAAAVVSPAGEVIVRRHETMARGQAERLMPLLVELLTSAGLDCRDLGALGVGIGPGNFTGVRIAVAAARGLAMGLGVPVVGMTGFALLAPPGAPPTAELRTLPAPRNRLHAQLWLPGGETAPPFLLDPAALPDDLLQAGLTIRGHRAHELAARLGTCGIDVELDDLPERLARQAWWQLQQQGRPDHLPAPLYIRPPDASPPADPPPVILDA